MKDIQILDNCLRETINYLIANWHNEDTGIVACALKDDDKIAFATSTRCRNNWLHAERNAYIKFKDLYGEPTNNAAFVITLSPCKEQLKYRAESSCSELIKQLGVKRIHFGVLDTQHVSCISSYSDIGFMPTLTQDNAIKTICSNLMNLFAKYDARINTELPTIKKELGNSFFSSIYN